MKFKWVNKENWNFWYYDIGTRKEFRFTYKLPTMFEIKRWWNKLWKKK